MPRPAALASAALLTGLTGLALVGAPATAATPAPPSNHQQSFTKTAITVETMVGPNNDVPCTVRADKYQPAGVSKAHPAPAILTTNGFGGAKDDDGQSAGASAFAKAGYVVISYSGLGFGGSDCKIALDDPDYDGKAGKQLVDVLAGTRAYTLDDGSGRQEKIDYVTATTTARGRDPKVGMIGGSYGGQIQFAVAGQDPRIDAIIPMITWNDLSYSLAPNNTDFLKGAGTGVTYGTPGVAKREWVDLFFGVGILAGLENAQTDPTRNVGCPNFRDEACAAAAALNTLGYPDDATLALARHASVSSYISRIKVPTLIVQGQRDTLFNLQEGVATYKALRAQGTEARMSWFSGGHSGETAAGDLDLSKGVDYSHQGRRWIGWMDRYVRGDTAASAGPQFEYFRDWISYDASEANAGTAVDKAYASSSGFTGAPTSTLRLSGTDALTPGKTVLPGSSQFAVTPAGTSYSETSGVEGSTVDRPISDTPGTFAAYTSPALRKDAVLVGSPRLTVRLDAPVAATAQSGGPAGQLILIAKLYDVAPDGTQTLQHRLVSPARIKDVTKPVTIELPGVAQRFAAGHRIRLVIAGGDLAYATNTVAQPVTVTTGPTPPGTLELPLLSAPSF
ncbi:MAG: family peptidase [Marmoricola sp.]|nr:family peptidase [Marmoricola sp.]